MTNPDVISSAPVLAAIDISKNRHEVLIQAPDKKRNLRDAPKLSDRKPSDQRALG